MRRLLLAAALLAWAGCRRSGTDAPPHAPTVETVAGVALIDYDAPNDSFRCRAPGDWKLLEDDALGPGEVSFIEPASAAARREVRLSISRYPNAVDRHADAEAYARALAAAGATLRRESIGGRTLLWLEREGPARRLHSARTEYSARESAALVPVPGGFYRLEHVAPADSFRRTLPVFEALLRSFEPGPR